MNSTTPTFGDQVTWTDRHGDHHGRVVGRELWDPSCHGSGPLRRVLIVYVADGQWVRVWADQVTGCRPDRVQATVARLVE